MTDVRLERLTENSRRSSCPYKGDSNFYDAEIGDVTVDNVAWTYTLPRPESTPIAGLICFFNEQVDIDIDGERQPRPQTHLT